MTADLKWGTIAGVFFVHWSGAPTRAAMRVIAPEIEKLSKQSSPVVFLSLATAFQRPTGEETDAWGEFVVSTLRAHCLHAHAVIDTPGIAGAIVRSAVTSVLILKGYTSKVSIHASILDAFHDIERRHGIAMADLMRGARLHDLLPLAKSA